MTIGQVSLLFLLAAFLIVSATHQPPPGSSSAAVAPVAFLAASKHVVVDPDDRGSASSSRGAEEERRGSKEGAICQSKIEERVFPGEAQFLRNVAAVGRHGVGAHREFAGDLLACAKQYASQ